MLPNGHLSEVSQQKILSPLNGGRSRKMSKVIHVVFALLFASSIIACGGDRFDYVETAGSAGVSGSDDVSVAGASEESEGGSDAAAGSTSEDGVGGRKTAGVGGRKVSDESEGGSDAVAGSKSDECVGGRRATGVGGKISDDTEPEGGSDATAGSSSEDTGVGGRRATGVGGKSSDDTESEGGSDAAAGSTSSDIIDEDDDGEPAERDCNDEDDEISHLLDEDCDDGNDDDCNGRADCEDSECTTSSRCSTEADEDHDGDPAAIDCNDEDDEISHLLNEDCDDGKDNNCDGRADCEDSECTSTSYCSIEVDADDDGELAVDDCNDGDPRISHFLNEDCDDGKDNDCDGMQDCDDPDCSAFSFCNGGSVPTTGTRIEVHNLLPKQVGDSFESLSDFDFGVVFPEEHADASCNIASIMDPLTGEYVQGVRCTIERKVDEE